MPPEPPPDPFEFDDIRFPYMYFKHEARVLYDSDHTQWSIAALIMLNFTTNIVEKQIDPHGDNHADTFQVLEDIFNVLFLLELMWNFYGHAFIPFCKSAWNWFDVTVVVVGIMSLTRNMDGEPCSLPCHAAPPGRSRWRRESCPRRGAPVPGRPFHPGTHVSPRLRRPRRLAPPPSPRRVERGRQLSPGLGVHRGTPPGPSWLTLPPAATQARCDSCA